MVLIIMWDNPVLIKLSTTYEMKSLYMTVWIICTFVKAAIFIFGNTKIASTFQPL